MSKLNSAIELDYKRFLRWWKRELSFLIPAGLAELVSDQRGTLIVQPEANQFVLGYAQAEHYEKLLTVPRDEAGIAMYKDLLETDPRLEKANLILRLSKKYAIKKELSLPAAAKENLYQVVSYELSRYSPFKVEQAYFAVKPIDVENEPGQIRVLLILTAREVLDTFYNEIRAFGMTPKFVDYEDAPNQLDAYEEPYNLLPESMQQKTDKTVQIIHGLSAGLVALLLLAALAFPVWFQYRSVEELQEKIKAIERDAKSTKSLQLEVDALVDETKQLIDKKTEKPPVVTVLDTLSALMKDNTWLSYAQYASGQIQMQGESPAASSLISVLEASDIFANAKFVSPVTRDNVSKLERFQITADITKAGEVIAPGDGNGTAE